MAEVHRAVYARHPEVMSLASALPTHATAFSVVGRQVETAVIPESYVVLRDIQTCPFALPFTDPGSVAELISMQRPVLMIENNGVLVAGSSIVDAFDRLEVLESSAETLLMCRAFNNVGMMSEETLSELRRAMPEAYGALRGE